MTCHSVQNESNELKSAKDRVGHDSEAIRSQCFCHAQKKSRRKNKKVSPCVLVVNTGSFISVDICEVSPKADSLCFRFTCIGDIDSASSLLNLIC